MTVGRKVDLSFINSVCPQLSATLVLQRTLAGQDLSAPVALDEIDRLSLPSTIGKDVVKWRDRILSNMRKACNASQTGGDVGMGQTQAVVRAAMQGMTFVEPEPEAPVVASTTACFDYTKSPVVDWETSVPQLASLVACGDGLLATTPDTDKYLFDVVSQERARITERSLEGVIAIAALRDGTVLTLPSPRTIALVVSGETVRTCEMKADVRWAKALPSGGFIVGLKNNRIQCHDQHGTQKCEWKEDTGSTDTQVLAGDHVAHPSKRNRGIDVRSATTGEVVRSWKTRPNAAVLLGRWVALSDGRLLVTTKNLSSYKDETRLVDHDGTDTLVDGLDEAPSFALPDGHVARPQNDSLLVCNARGEVLSESHRETKRTTNHRPPSVVPLADGRLAIGDYGTNRITVYRFPEAT